MPVTKTLAALQGTDINRGKQVNADLKQAATRTTRGALVSKENKGSAAERNVAKERKTTKSENGEVNRENLQAVQAPAPRQRNQIGRHLILPRPEIEGTERELSCIEVADDVVLYLFKHEQLFTVPEQFLDGKPVTGKMRSILIDWIVQVHDRFRLLPETFYLAVYVVDSYLNCAEMDKTKLQLLGITALFISCKFEEMYTPDIRDFEFISDGVFTRQQIFHMEIEILRKIGFLLSRPAPIYFLRYLCSELSLSKEIHETSKYFAEVGVQNYLTGHVRPSHLAAAAMCLSVSMHGNEPMERQVRRLMHVGSANDEFDLVRSRLASAVLINQGHQKLRGIKTKFAIVRFGFSSNLSEENAQWLKDQFEEAV